MPPIPENRDATFILREKRARRQNLEMQGPAGEQTGRLATVQSPLIASTGPRRGYATELLCLRAAWS